MRLWEATPASILLSTGLAAGDFGFRNWDFGFGRLTARRSRVPLTRFDQNATVSVCQIRWGAYRLPIHFLPAPLRSCTWPVPLRNSNDRLASCNWRLWRGANGTNRCAEN